MLGEEEGISSTKGLNKSCILVIVVAGVERFAFKGVASNLVTYLTEVVKLSNSSAAKTVNNWCGVSFLLPLFGAFLADSYLDRYSTILFSSFLYIGGLGALTSTAMVWEWKTNSHPQSSTSIALSCSTLLWSLLLISLGQGGYNPCLQAFGADQLELNQEQDDDDEDSQNSNNVKKSSFFKWWYFGICSGSMLGVSLMSYIQDTLGWGLGFAIPTIAMAISVSPFSCGTKFYTIHKNSHPAGNKSIKKLIHSIKTTASKILNKNITLPSKLSDVVELELQEKPLCFQDSEQSISIDKISNSVEDPIQETKSILRLMPIWVTLLMFAIIFQQPATFFTKQGVTMKRNIGNHFMIPPATLQIAINISVLLLMPFYDKIVVPIYRIITGKDRRINVMERMGFGMFLSTIAMAIAAIVETKRLEISRKSPLPSLSIFWLLPQYILLGFSDVFTVVGMQEFFYTEVPNKMKTMGMALHLSVFGIGSFLSAFLISLIELFTSDSEGKHSWFSDNMREARLDNFYWILALLSALSLFFFIVLCKYYNRVN